MCGIKSQDFYIKTQKELLTLAELRFAVRSEEEPGHGCSIRIRASSGRPSHGCVPSTTEDI